MYRNHPSLLNFNPFFYAQQAIPFHQVFGTRVQQLLNILQGLAKPNCCYIFYNMGHGE